VWFSLTLVFPSCRTQSSSLYSVFDHTTYSLLMFMLTKLSDVKQTPVLVSLCQLALETSAWTSKEQIVEPVSQGFWSFHLKDWRHVVCRGHGAGVTLDDFTFWISLLLRPKLNLSDKVCSQSRVWISWADIFGLVLGLSKKTQSEAEIWAQNSDSVWT